MAEALRVIISGRVQGVSYRAWTVERASSKKLKGWVRNRSDGTVEAVFCGDAAAIKDMVEACKQGPGAARVDKIESFRWEELIEQDRFVTRQTV